MSFYRLRSDAVSVSLDLRVGHLRDFAVKGDARVLRPLFTAPWADGGVQLDLPVEQYLSGDFLCAPFAASNIESAPLHGWSANSTWQVLEGEVEEQATFVLERRIMGARVIKTLKCADGAPLLYQTHRFEGGRGALPIAHHVMTQCMGGARLAFSEKSHALTPNTAPLPGKNALQYPSQGHDIYTFKGEKAAFDLTTFPLADSHEDFVSLAEKHGATFGWSAVLRDAENDILFVLKDPRELPVTMLWSSHKANAAPPWSHTEGLLAIEDGRSGVHSGHSASLEPSRLTRAGIPTAMNLDDADGAILHHVIGAIERPKAWDTVTEILLNWDQLTIVGSDGTSVEMPFDPDFFTKGH